MTEQDTKEINKVNNERILKILEENIEKTNTFINQLERKLEGEGTIEEKELIGRRVRCEKNYLKDLEEFKQKTLNKIKESKKTDMI